MTIDTTGFQLAPDISGDDDEDTALLQSMADDALSYVRSFRWAPPIAHQWLAYGLGGIIALFLFDFERPVGGFEDRQLWIVVGDLPSAYFVTDECPTASAALEVYCELMQAWADAVLHGDDLSGVFPVQAAPTEGLARMLLSRMAFVREKVVPIADED